jgi:aminoglycoside/choline kinase family phosphotransferase
MATITEQISRLVQAHFHQQPNRIAQLPPSGSNRTYYRVYLPHQTVIATYNNNVRENETFVRFSAHFKQLQLPVPAVWAMNDEHTIYLQEDLGDTSLLHVLESQGFTPEVFSWFQQSLTMLARLQILGHRQFP